MNKKMMLVFAVFGCVNFAGYGMNESAVEAATEKLKNLSVETEVDSPKGSDTKLTSPKSPTKGWAKSLADVVIFEYQARNKHRDPDANVISSLRTELKGIDCTRERELEAIGMDICAKVKNTLKALGMDDPIDIRAIQIAVLGMWIKVSDGKVKEWVTRLELKGKDKAIKEMQIQIIEALEAKEFAAELANAESNT